MNQLVTIGGNFPQGTRQGGFDILDFITGISDFPRRSALWYGTSISDNPGRGSLFKNAGHGIFFEVEKYGSKKSKIQIQLNHAKSNHTELI